MADPQQVTSNNIAATAGVGPFLSGGRLYALLRSSTLGQISIYKAPTDPFSGTWPATDTAGEPSTNTTHFYSAQQDGTNLFITSATTDGSPSYDAHIFSMSSDTWTTTDETIENTVTTGGPGGATHVTARSDGDWIMGYAGPAVSIMGTDFPRSQIARREAGSWTTNITIGADNKVEVQERNSSPVMSVNDRCHIFFSDDVLNLDLAYSTYLSNNTFGHTLTNIDDTLVSGGTSDDAMHASIGVAFDRSGTEKIRFPYMDSAGTMTVVEFDDADNPGTPTLNTGASNNNTYTPSNIVMAVTDAGATYALFVNSTDQDLYYNNTGDGDDTWSGSDTEIEDGIFQAHPLSANHYTRDGDEKIGYLFLLSGVSFSEITFDVVHPTELLSEPFDPTYLRM